MTLSTPFFSALLGKPVTRVWRGHGSALFIEFGELSPSRLKNGGPENTQGELTLMIQWGWRIERPKSILGGSWSSENRWPGIFEKIMGATVADVQLFGALPEICVTLSNGLRITSFMTAEGQPEWTILTRVPELGSLCVRKGNLHIEPPKS